MKKIIAMLIVAVFALTAFAALAENGTLTMCTNAQFPPYEFYGDDPDVVIGIDADIARAICAKLGYELEIVDADFDSLIPSVKEHKFDFAAAGMTVTEERKEIVQFTDTYATGIQVIIVPEDCEFESIDDFVEANGTVKIADGQSLYNGSEVLSGTITDMSKLNGKTLRPYKTITLADAADNSSTIREWNGSVAEVTLQGRTLTKDGNWNTLCLPFAVNSFAGTPLEGATVKELDATLSSLAGNTLTLKFKDATSIEAGKPYIIKWTTTGDNIVNPVFSNVTISSTTPTAVESYDHTVTFVGQYSPFSIVESGATGSDQGNKNEILLMTKGNKIGYSKNPRTLKCFRCHFYVPTSSGEFTARNIEVDFGEGEATSVASMEDGRSKMEDVYYTLDGRKLEGKPTAKGMYIVNGRKVIIK